MAISPGPDKTTSTEVIRSSSPLFARRIEFWISKTRVTLQLRFIVRFYSQFFVKTLRTEDDEPVSTCNQGSSIPQNSNLYSGILTPTESYDDQSNQLKPIDVLCNDHSGLFGVSLSTESVHMFLQSTVCICLVCLEK